MGELQGVLKNSDRAHCKNNEHVHELLIYVHLYTIYAIIQAPKQLK